MTNYIQESDLVAMPDGRAVIIYTVESSTLTLQNIGMKDVWRLPSVIRLNNRRQWLHNAASALQHKGASTLCHVAECNKMRPCCAANGGNDVDLNAVLLRQGFYMPQKTMRHENSIGKMSVSSKVCHTEYKE